MKSNSHGSLSDCMCTNAGCACKRYVAVVACGQGGDMSVCNAYAWVDSEFAMFEIIEICIHIMKALAWRSIEDGSVVVICG